VKSGRDYRAEYGRRKRRARELGFGSVRELAAAKRPTRVEDFAALPEAARASRSNAMRAIRIARDEDMTIEDATLGLIGVPVSTVKFWAGDALQPTRNGKTLPTKGDRLLRLRPLIVEGGSELEFVAVRGSRAAARADRIFEVQWAYVHGEADETELDQISELRVAGRSVETNADRLAILAAAGAIEPDAVYAALVA
jgi:hypothetical protein